MRQSFLQKKTTEIFYTFYILLQNSDKRGAKCRYSCYTQINPVISHLWWYFREIDDSHRRDIFLNILKNRHTSKNISYHEQWHFSNILEIEISEKPTTTIWIALVEYDQQGTVRTSKFDFYYFHHIFSPTVHFRVLLNTHCGSRVWWHPQVPYVSTAGSLLDGGTATASLSLSDCCLQGRNRGHRAISPSVRWIWRTGWLPSCGKGTNLEEMRNHTKALWYHIFEFGKIFSFISDTVKGCR